MNAASLQVDGNLKHIIETSRTRLIFIGLCMLLCYLGISVRLVDLTTDNLRSESKHLPYLNLASKTEVRVGRRNVVDRNGELLATNLKTASLYANPRVMIDKDEAVWKLHTLFPELSEAELWKKFSADRSFVWIKRHLHPNEQEAINNLGIPGLEFWSEEKRVYPHAGVVAHALGLVDVDGKGVAGVEKEFQDELGIDSSVEDAPLSLAIDIRVQSILHKEMVHMFQKHEAIGAAGIVMDVHTGEIISLVSLPEYDPNLQHTAKQDALFNRATLGVYELGSVFKTFTAAQALDEDIATFDSIYDARKSIKVGRHRISDFHPEKRELTLPEVMMYSSNIGAAHMADEIGFENQQRFMEKLGFFDPIALELPENGTPIIPSNWGRITSMTVSFGHGIAVTPLHVASAYATMVNGGKRVEPTLIANPKPYDKEQIIKPQTSDDMRRLLRLVATQGSGQKAAVEGYVVGGKTGTAEKAGINAYDRKRLISTFAGTFPMHDPKYVLLVMMDEPKATKDTFGFATAGWTAAPIVGRTIAQMAPILGIEPVNENSPEIFDALYVNVPEKKKKKR